MAHKKQHECAKEKWATNMDSSHGYAPSFTINSDEDVRVRSDTGWYKRVLRSLNVQVSTGIPYSPTGNPLCEQQIRVLKENVRIWCKTERTRDWVRLLPVISLMMNSQESSATGYSPHELFLGRPAWFLHAAFPEDTHSSVGAWVQEQQAKVDKAKAMRKVYSGFSTVFFSLLLLAAGVGFPAACFWR